MIGGSACIWAYAGLGRVERLMRGRVLIGMACGCMLLLAWAAPSWASAGSHAPRVSAPLPASVFISSHIHIAGRLSPVSRAARAELQQHTSRGWANVGSSRISSPGMFTLTWLTPHRPTHVTLRIVVTRHGRTIATTATKSVDVSPQPIVVSPSDVFSVPPPGQPGIVVLHAHAPGGGARVATASAGCPTLNSIPQVGQILAVGYSATTPYGSLTKIESVDVLGPCKVTLNTSPATLEEAIGSNGGVLDLAHFSEVGAGSASDARAHAAISAGS